jgi:hypothetical protein
VGRSGDPLKYPSLFMAGECLISFGPENLEEGLGIKAVLL